MNFYQRASMTLAAAAVLTLTSCGKSTRINRLEGDWELVGGEAYDPDERIVFEFEEGGDFTFNYDGDVYRGDWDWDGDLDSDLEVDFNTGYYRVELEFEVKELDKENLELEDNYGNDWEFEKD